MTHRVAFVVFDGVTLLDVSGPAEVLHQVGQLGHPYELVLISALGGEIRASNGLTLNGTVTATEAGRIDTVVVAGGGRLAEQPLEAELLATTGAVAARATRVASASRAHPSSLSPDLRSPSGQRCGDESVLSSGHQLSA